MTLFLARGIHWSSGRWKSECSPSRNASGRVDQTLDSNTSSTLQSVSVKRVFDFTSLFSPLSPHLTLPMSIFITATYDIGPSVNLSSPSELLSTSRDAASHCGRSYLLQSRPHPSGIPSIGTFKLSTAHPCFKPHGHTLFIHKKGNYGQLCAPDRG